MVRDAEALCRMDSCTSRLRALSFISQHAQQAQQAQQARGARKHLEVIDHQYDGAKSVVYI